MCYFKCPYNRLLYQSTQSNDSIITGDDDLLVGTMDMDHVSQQLETLVSVVVCTIITSVCCLQKSFHSNISN